jgi:hypothetical protein
MSSSRVQASLTGRPTSFAISTAWRTKSWKMPRRPKPPPSIILWIKTLLAGMPAASAAIASAVSPSWVGAQTSTKSAVTRAVQFCGSMVACARKGTS